MRDVERLAFSQHDGGGQQQGRPPFVLIHGTGGTRHSWPPEVRRLESETVFAIDLPGHGESSGDGQSSISAYAALLRSWIESIPLERPILVGHSLGGAISMSLALEMPEKLSGLVLVGTGGRLRVHPVILRLTADSEGSEEAMDRIHSWAYSSEAPERLIELARERMADVPLEVYHNDFLACDRFDILHEVGNIRLPTLVICGSEDQLTPVKYSQFLADEIPDARLKLIESAGHMVMLEKPAEVAQAIKDFQASLVGGRV